MTAPGGIRSILFVPGSRPDRFDKAAASGADLVCIDLEDAVPAADKQQARAAAVKALRMLDPFRLAIRVNGLETLEGLRDLVALAEAETRPALVFIPMAAAAAHVDIAREALGAVGLVPLIETPDALRRASEIAAASGVAGMMFGGGDLSARLGVELAWEPLQIARGQFVLACADRCIALIDVPYIDIKNEACLEVEARRARALGFTAKAAIHPAQVATINRVFAPAADELEEARAALAAYRNAGGRAIQHEGRMLEEPLVRRYQAMLEQEEAGNA